MNDLYGPLDEKKKKRKKAGSESSKESSLRDWFGRKGAKGKKKGGLIVMRPMEKAAISPVGADPVRAVRNTRLVGPLQVPVKSGVKVNHGVKKLKRNLKRKTRNYTWIWNRLFKKK